MPVTITARKNGPYRVEATDGAEIKGVDPSTLLPSTPLGTGRAGADGKAFDLKGKTAFSLCGCGHSANKPFCDGTHGKIGFQADDLAPRQEGE